MQNAFPPSPPPVGEGEEEEGKGVACETEREGEKEEALLLPFVEEGKGREEKNHCGEIRLSAIGDGREGGDPFPSSLHTLPEFRQICVKCVSLLNSPPALCSGAPACG